MKNRSRNLVAVVLASALLLGQTAHADWEEDHAQIAAEVVYRPAGVVLLAGGTALFVVVLPFSLLTKSTKDTANTLVKKPFDWTFKRPVGSGV